MMIPRTRFCPVSLVMDQFPAASLAGTVTDASGNRAWGLTVSLNVPDYAYWNSQSTGWDGTYVLFHQYHASRNLPFCGTS